MEPDPAQWTSWSCNAPFATWAGGLSDRAFIGRLPNRTAWMQGITERLPGCGPGAMFPPGPFWTHRHLAPPNPHSSEVGTDAVR